MQLNYRKVNIISIIFITMLSKHVQQLLLKSLSYEILVLFFNEISIFVTAIKIKEKFSRMYVFFYNRVKQPNTKVIEPR